MDAAATASRAVCATRSAAAGLIRSTIARLQHSRTATPTHYRVLGLAADAGEPQIKSAYRTLARRFHPDVNAGDAEAAARLAEINLAYETLGDPKARAAYDGDLARLRRAARRHYALLAASTAVTFLVTVAAVAYALRWQPPAPPRATLAAAPKGSVPLPAPLPVVVLPGPREGVDLGVPPPAGDGPGWTTYRDTLFAFALRYPAGVFAFDPTQSDRHVHTFTSHDRRATLRVIATPNTARISLASFRSALIKERYAGASFRRTQLQRHWFALSGTRGQEVFQERITFSCDGKSMHGWQLHYPASQRASYDDLAAVMLRNRPHGNGPSGGCASERGKAKRHSRRRRQ
ncbi:MAG TPA: DnaJ domain-containing protein [Hyphomicrobiaceae bacterium]|nr:DnaJ domain-containing protein [Hyphomicrobiaceae bacterium]